MSSRSRSRSRSPSLGMKEGKQEIVESPNLETIPMEILEMIVEKSENLRNVRQASKSFRQDLGGPLGNADFLEYPLGTDKNIFSMVSPYLESEDIRNLRLVSSGMNKLTIKDWKKVIEKSIQSIPIGFTNIQLASNVSMSLLNRDVKIFKLLKLLNWNSRLFKDLLNHVVGHYRFEIRALVYLATQEGIVDIIGFIERNNLYKRNLISHDNESNLLFFAIQKWLKEADVVKKEKLMRMITELFAFGFNPAYKNATKNAYDLLGKENAEALFGPESNYPEYQYALDHSRLDKLFDFPKKKSDFFEQSFAFDF